MWGGKWREHVCYREALLQKNGDEKSRDTATKRDLRSISNGQVAHHGTNATQCSFCATIRLSLSETLSSK